MDSGKNMFYRQVAIVAASNLSLQVLGFIYRILLTRMAGAEGMGVYSLVMQIYTIAYSFCISGIFVAVNTVGARLYAAGNILMVRRLVRIAFLALFSLFFVLAAPTALSHRQIAVHILNNPETDRAILLVLLCIFLTGVENVLKAAFLGAKLVKHTSISELLEQILRMVLVLMLLYCFANGVHGITAMLIVLGMTLSELFSVSFLGVSYIRRFLLQKGKGDRREHGIARSFFDIAVPSVVTALTCNVFSAVATLLFPARLQAAGFTQSQAVGTLGVLTGMAGPVFLLPAALTASVCTVLLPRVSAAAATKNQAALEREISRGLVIVGCASIPFTALLIPYVPLICMRLFGQQLEAKLVFALALQAAIAQYMSIAVCIQNGSGGHKKVLQYALLGEGLQLILVYWLTALPNWNVYGYLFGMILGDSARAILGLRYAFQQLHIHSPNTPWFMKPAVMSLLMYAAACILLRFITGFRLSVPMSVSLSLLLCLSIYVLLLWSTGTFTRKN